MSAEEAEKWRGKTKPGMHPPSVPDDVRDAFIRHKGIDWTSSYIDPATWLPASRAIVAKTHIAERRIRDQASGICDMLRVSIKPPPEAHARIAAE